MPDLGSASVLPLVGLRAVTAYATPPSAQSLGSAATLPLTSLRAVTAYSLAGTYTPPPCPDCPELPGPPTEGIVWPLTFIQEADMSEAIAQLQADVAQLQADVTLLKSAVTSYPGANNQTGTSYTIVLTDAGKLVTLTNAAAVTVTIPPAASVAFPALSRIDFAGLGTGLVTFAPGAGVTINATPSLVTRARYSAVTAVKTGTDTWLLVGDLA